MFVASSMGYCRASRAMATSGTLPPRVTVWGERERERRDGAMHADRQPAANTTGGRRDLRRAVADRREHRGGTDFGDRGDVRCVAGPDE